MSNFQSLINNACLFFDIDKSDFQKKQRLSVEKLYIVVAVYFIMYKKSTDIEIQKHINKHRVTFYHYRKIIKTEFAKIYPIIKKLQNEEKETKQFFS